MTNKTLFKITYTLLAGETPLYNNTMFTHAYSHNQALIQMKHRLGKEYNRTREVVIHALQQ